MNRWRLQVNQHVRWHSTYTTSKVFYGRVTSVLDDRYCMVDDGSGKRPRLVRADRLDVVTDRFAGGGSRHL